MKIILIETVSNGWIVRASERNSDWPATCQAVIAVYNDLRDLTDDLPRLLDSQTPPTPARNSYSVINPPPVTARDSDGGDTGL